MHAPISTAAGSQTRTPSEPRSPATSADARATRRSSRQSPWRREAVDGRETRIRRAEGRAAEATGPIPGRGPQRHFGGAAEEAEVATGEDPGQGDDDRRPPCAGQREDGQAATCGSKARGEGRRAGQAGRTREGRRAREAGRRNAGT